MFFLILYKYTHMKNAALKGINIMKKIRLNNFIVELQSYKFV